MKLDKYEDLVKDVEKLLESGPNTSQLAWDTLKKSLARIKSTRDTYVHTPSGVKYEIVTRAYSESDASPIVVYSGPDGKKWTRPESDWNNKFEKLPPAEVIKVVKITKEDFPAIRYDGSRETGNIILDWLGKGWTVNYSKFSFGNMEYMRYSLPSGKNVDSEVATFTKVGRREFESDVGSKITMQPGDWIIKDSSDGGMFKCIADKDFGDLGYSRKAA